MKRFPQQPGICLPLLIGGLLLAGLGALCAQNMEFIRGDLNEDTCVDAVDAEILFEWLENAVVFPCLDAADANNDDTVDMADGIYILQFAEQGGPPPDVPFPACGLDASSIRLGCEHYPEAACQVPPCHASPIRFVRGDTNDDGGRDISDAILVLLHLFAAGAAPRCMDAADVNDDGEVNITDALGLLLFLFSPDGLPPPPPSPECGVDVTSDRFEECVFTSCQR